MPTSVICVDSDQAFASILKESLEQNGDFQVTLAPNSAQAIQTLEQDVFDLAIVDIGIQDMAPMALLKAIRQAQPRIRLVLIPLFGDEVPHHLTRIKIQGLLPKPFFVEDLARIVETALNRELQLPIAPIDNDDDILDMPDDLSEDDPFELDLLDAEINHNLDLDTDLTAGNPAERPNPGHNDEKQIMRQLDDLNRELQAEAIVLTVGEDLVATVGFQDAESAAQLTGLLADSARNNAKIAQFLGEPHDQFEQSLLEGSKYRLYSVNLGEDAVLTLALNTKTPLGAVRYRVRQTAEEMKRLLL